MTPEKDGDSSVAHPATSSENGPTPHEGAKAATVPGVESPPAGSSVKAGSADAGAGEPTEVRLPVDAGDSIEIDVDLEMPDQGTVELTDGVPDEVEEVTEEVTEDAEEVVLDGEELSFDEGGETRGSGPKAPPPMPLLEMPSSPGTRPSRPPPIAAASPVPQAPSPARMSSEEARRSLRENSWRDRAAAIEKELGIERDPSRIAVLEYEMGTLLDAVGEDPTRAEEAHGRALAADASLKPNLWALRRISEGRGRWDKVIELIDIEARTATTGVERAELLVEKGHLLADRMGDAAAAQGAWKAAVAENPSSLAALMALERVALRANDIEAIVDVLRRQANATGEPGRKAALLVELAEAVAARGGAAEEVYGLLREAEQVASPERALAAIERFAQAAEKAGGAGRERATEELSRAIDARVQLAEAAAGPDMAEQVLSLRRRQAQLLGEQDPARARAVLEAALEHAATDRDAALLLDDLVESAEKDGRFGDLADLLARRTPRLTGPAAARAAFARARALRRAGRDAEAAEVETQLAAEPAVGLALLVEHERHAADAGDLAALAAGLDGETARARAAGDAAWSAFAFVQKATAYERLGDSESAIAAYREAVASRPGDAAALDGLDLLLARAGRHAERAQVLEAKLAAADAAGTARVLEALVDLRLDWLGDVDGAMAAAEALCTLRGGIQGDDVAGRARLVEIARGAGRFAETATHLEKLAGALERAGAPAQAALAHLERAHLLEHQIEDGAGAIAALEAILSTQPLHPIARTEARRVQAKLGRWDAVASSLQAEIGGTPAPAQLAALLGELADVEERRGRPEAAAEAWRALAERVPDDPRARRIRKRQAEKSARPEELARFLDEAVDGESRVEQGRRLLQAGEVYEDALDNPAVAAAAYMRSLACGGDAAPHAAFGLYRSLARAADDVALDGALAALAAHAKGSTAAALAEERSHLSMAAGDGDAARTQLDEALAADPSLPLPQLSRARLSAQGGSPALLGESLGALGEITSDPRLRAVYFTRAALLASVTGGDASSHARAALETELPPDDAAAIANAIGVVVDDPRALAKRIAVAEPGLRAALRLERIDALMSRGRLADAAEETQRGLAEDPADVVLLETARRIAWRGGDRLGEARAAAALGMALSAGERATAMLSESARTLEELNERAEAATVWRTLLAERPSDDEAFRRCRDLVRHLDDDGALEALLTDRIVIAASQEKLALLVERGDLRRRTARPHAAAADYQAALAIDPENRDALRRLGDHFAAGGDRAGAIASFERLVARSGTSDPARRELLLSIAALEEARGNGTAAAGALRRVVEVDSDDGETLVRLSELLENGGDTAGAVEVLRARARLAQGSERAGFELRVATLLRRARRDPQGARSALGRALAAEPLNLDALRELMSLCEEEGEALIRDGALTQASLEAQRAITEDPRSPEPYRVLERVCEWQGDDDARQLAMQAAAAVAGRPVPPRREGMEPSRTIPADWWDRFLGAELRSVAMEVWREAAEAAPRLFGPDVTALGVGRATRQNEKSLPPAWTWIDRLARALGVTSYALHVLPRLDFCALAGDALLVGNNFASPPAPPERFRVARKMVLLRDRLGPLETASDLDLELFFGAAAQVAGVRWEGAARQAEQRVEDWTKQMNKALDRRARKALTALAPRFGMLPDVNAWRRRLLDGATRLALACTGDLGAALSALSLDPASDDGRALARFAVSDDLTAMRRALGTRS